MKKSILLPKKKAHFHIQQYNGLVKPCYSFLGSDNKELWERYNWTLSEPLGKIHDISFLIIDLK